MTKENSNLSENPEKDDENETKKEIKKKTKKKTKNKDSYIPEDTNDLDSLDYIEDNYDRNC